MNIYQKSINRESGEKPNAQATLFPHILLILKQCVQCYVLAPHVKLHQFLLTQFHFPCPVGYSKSSVHTCVQVSSAMDVRVKPNTKRPVTKGRRAHAICVSFDPAFRKDQGKVYPRLFAPQDHSPPPYDSLNANIQQAGKHPRTDRQAPTLG